MKTFLVLASHVSSRCGNQSLRFSQNCCPEHEEEQASRAVLLMNTFFDSEIYKSCRRYQESMCRLNLEMNHSDSVKIVVHEKEKQPLY
jgi:hypothetical protein